jgi:transaldolase
MANPLSRLNALGQSIWYDYIRRDLFTSGDLSKMIREDLLAGMTSNPTIFAGAIAKSSLYDADIAAAARAKPNATDAEIFEIRRACDEFKGVFVGTNGRDGYVSIEVSPKLARDTQGTISEARRLWKAVDRANCMIKIPGTKEGLPAIETCLADGINVNVTLLFSIERYEEVMDAWLRALEKRVAAGQPVDRIASVASFFVSRVDSNTDAAIDKAAPTLDAGKRAQLEALKSKIAIANARLAYEAWEKKVASSPRFVPLRVKGAMPQRPLWASTSTKDPKLSDVLYIETLIGPDTVNTVPPQTYAAYRDHGAPGLTIREDLAGARAALATLAACGVDFAAITKELEDDGVKKFAQSFDELMASIASKRAAIHAGKT